MNYDIIVVGGGAAGLAAAISAKETAPDNSVAVLEKGERVGKKLAITGNGRCNITNKNLSLARFHGKDSRFAEYALRNFGLDYTLSFFERMGVLIKFEDSGKAYPYSLQAAGVTDALRFRAADLGVDIIPGCEVKKIRKGFNIMTSNGEYRAKRVILTAGGYAAPKSGSDGSGCRLLRELGHTSTKILPAIVQLKTDNTLTRSLKGIKTDALATVTVGGKPVRKELGEILFTEYGLSGPPILQLSRIASENVGKAAVEVSLDLMPEYSSKQTFDMISRRVGLLGSRSLDEFFTAMLNKRLGQTVIKSCGLALSSKAGALNRDDIHKINHALHNFTFSVKDTTGFANAQTTAGGISTAEFDEKTMCSRLVRGLFAAGEVLDIDGDCGGYNLQWAWSSGILSGISAAKSL